MIEGDIAAFMVLLRLAKEPPACLRMIL